jgi:formylglycine-generating enzyme required for sulfatase activity
MGGGNVNAEPIHKVALDAYWIDQTEVTNAMFAKFLNDIASHISVEANKFIKVRGFPIYDLICTDCKGWKDRISWDGSNFSTIAGYEEHPVALVTWYGADAYCSWAGRRLPTEAEWEKAARGTDTRTYPWGEGIDCAHADYSDCKQDTTAVGNYEIGKSPYGAYDMAGNVWEWVSSLYKPYPYDAHDGREDLTASGTRVLRGGSWDDIDYVVRTAVRRRSGVPSVLFNLIGFRCARGTSPYGAHIHKSKDERFTKDSEIFSSFIASTALRLRSGRAFLPQLLCYILQSQLNQLFFRRHPRLIIPAAGLIITE